MSKILMIAVALAISACGNKSNNGGHGGGGGKPVPPNRVNWAAVPAEFNPSVNDIDFQTDGGVTKVDVDVFGFREDVEVVYADLPAGTGKLRTFRVYKNSASWGDLRAQRAGTTVNLKNYGSYECQISIQNGQVTALKGGCYVRLQIFLPLGAQVEVYNVGELLTKRFVPVSAENFLESLGRATWSEQKFAVIAEYINSYTALGKQPSLSSEQLQTVLRDFIRGEEKLKALSQLHTAVSDRNNLAAVLDREFMFREREEARRITGL